MAEQNEATALSVIRQIWIDVLGVPEVSDSDNFFALGGESVVATVMAMLVEEAFDTIVGGDILFDHPTLKEFTAAVLAEAN